MIRSQKRFRKISINLLQEIFEFYQSEFKAPMIELVRGLVIQGDQGYLMFKDFKLSPLQINTLALTMPYILNIKHINMQNCNIKDEQCALIIRACSKLSKIKTLNFGQNQIGAKFISQLQMQQVNIEDKIERISLQFMKDQSSIQFSRCIETLKSYKSLRCLDLSGNQLTRAAAIHLASIISES